MVFKSGNPIFKGGEMRVIKRRIVSILLATALLLIVPRSVQAMHIMEGFLPMKWAIIWSLASLPFVIRGLVIISRKVANNPELKLLLGVAGAFTFILSALKIPSVTGSSSHPTGVGLGAVLFGPAVMSVVGCIVLVFQALLLAHGGLTTLGANTFSMAIAGPFAAALVFKAAKRVKATNGVAVFLAAFFGDLITYVVTSLQLALAFPSATGGVMLSAAKFLSIFALTQVPLAISEGLLTVLVFNFVSTYNKQELISLKVLQAN